jgi:class 3 adenylate cyclase
VSESRPAATAPATAPAGRSVLRPAVWVLHLTIPLLGLWLLLAQPQLDVIWEDHASHFWLVLLVAAVNVVLGLWMGAAARARSDARLFLVSLTFLSSAGFFLLHALATPDILLAEPNTGFTVAAPVGLAVASVFAALSSVDFTPERAAAVMRRSWWLVGGVIVLMAGWAGASLLEAPLLSRPLEAEESTLPLTILAVIGVPLYVLAALRYFVLYRRRRAVFLISVTTAFVLLAEAMVAMAVAVSWALTWWEWHVLMAVAFLFVAYSARVQERREGTTTSLFTAISLEETIRRIREEYGEALEALVETMRRQEETGEDQPIGPVADRLAARFDLTEGQTEVLERAAEALVHEREQITRLGALVAVGRETRVILEERDLLDRALRHAGQAFGRDRLRIGLVEEGRLRFPDAPDAEDRADVAEALRTLEPVEADGALALPITVKGKAAGLLEVRRPPGALFADRDRSVLQSLASQLSIALENVRLYRQIDALFRSYMSPDVATTLLADPAQAALGGAIVEATVLFADLRGYTTFSERSEPDEVVALLNRYFGTAVPIILEHGGTVAQFVGDAVMAMWNAPTRQPDHALRAGRAGLAMQGAIDQVAAGRPDWPRFRVGINSGPVLVGNIGSEEFRNFTAIGDTTNLASRLEGQAPVGSVLIGERTRELLGDAAAVEPVGELQVKGKERPVRAFLLRSILDGSPA